MEFSLNSGWVLSRLVRDFGFSTGNQVNVEMKRWLNSFHCQRFFLSYMLGKQSAPYSDQSSYMRPIVNGGLVSPHPEQFYFLNQRFAS